MTAPLTLATLANARGLTPGYLRTLGWQERPRGVAIPWLLAGGGVAWHTRHHLERDGPGPRWTWQNFDRTRLLPYGVDRLPRMREQSPATLVIVESEVDAACLWTVGLSVLASGGADMWQARWWTLTQGFGVVVLWVEDGGSLPLLRRLAETRPDDAPPLHVCHTLDQPAKDAGRLLAALNGSGQETLRRIVARAVPVTAMAGSEAELLRHVVERLGARESGARATARCPFHADREPSLSIFRGEDGGWAFRCHAGSCGVRGRLALLGAVLGIVPPAPARAEVGVEVGVGVTPGQEKAAKEAPRPHEADVTDSTDRRPGPADGGEGPAASARAAFGGSFLAPGAYPWPEMAEEAYYGLAGDVVRAVAPHTEADPVAILLSFLAAVSAALGPGPHVCVGETTHHLRVWPVLVGETAKARKGSSLAPVQRLLALADPAFADRRIASGLSSGEGLIWAVRDAITRWEKVKDPATKTADLQEVTVDPGEPDKRLLVVEEEFAGVLKVLSRDGNTLSAVLRQAWERGDLRTLTKNSPARASGAHIVVLGHAVGEELARYLLESEIAGGLANRFLFCCVRRSQCLPRGGRLPAETLAALAARLRQVFEWAQGQGDVELRWSDAAGRLWDAVYPALSEGKLGLVGALIARMEAQALRLAALSAVLDCSPEIRPEHLAAALAIVDYCEASARHIFGDRLGDPVADAIVEALRRAGPEGLSRWDLSNLLGRNVSSGRITHALAGLHAKGLARPERRETGGRPAEVWTWCGW